MDYKQRKRQYNKSVKDDPQKMKSSILRSIEKAEDLIQQKKEETDRVREGGISVETPDFEDIKSRLEKIKNKVETGKKIDYDTYRYLQDFGKKNVYDSMIRYNYTRYTSDEDGKTMSERIELTEEDIKKIKRKHAKQPSSLSDLELSILVKISKNKQNDVAPDTNDDEVQISKKNTLKVFSNEEDKQAFIDSFKVTRDTSIGGNSMLINQLWYAMDTDGWYGRYWCEFIQRAMASSPEVWIRLEQAYRSNKNDIKTKLEASMDAAWYFNFSQFKDSIIDLINEMDQLGEKVDEIKKTLDEEYMDM